VVGGGGGDGCEQDVVPDQIDDGIDRERDGGYISVALFSTHPTSSGNVTPHTQVKCITHGARACITRGVSSSACVHGGVKQCVCACVRACDGHNSLMSSMNPVESPALVGAVFVNISVAVVAVALNTAWNPKRGMGVTQVG
jgi:hypothetical protein